MLFSSIPFLYYFLPVVILVYAAAPKALKNTVLFLFSLIFYAWGESSYVFLMLFVILLGYVGGFLLERYRQTPYGKICLFLCIGVHVLILGYFKYADFMIQNLNRFLKGEIALLNVILPIGISFYIFQIISYLADVYRMEVKAQRNFLILAAYVSMFPQLIAGPIVRYKDVERQLQSRTHSMEMTAQGIRRFLLGLGKKILIANVLGECCSIFRQSDEKCVLFYWIYAVSFMLHIYFDFSGYSDMAIGLGKIFGFTFMENFNYPYIAGSVTEFWRRWHISLGTWFRDYVYIPMGGNRVGKRRWIFHIAVVWFLTGIWHGAAWNFIAWGLYFAVFLVMEKEFFMPILKKVKWLSHVYLLLTVMVSFVLFNAASLPQAAADIGGLVGIGTDAFITAECRYYFKKYLPVICAAAVMATPAGKILVSRLEKSVLGARVIRAAEPVVFAGLLLAVTAYLVDGSFNPFLYFRF